MSLARLETSWDSRPVISRLRRAQLYKLLDKREIPYPAGAPKEQMLKLLEASGVDLNIMVDDFDWYAVTGKDENGQEHTEYYPKQEPHESARIMAGGQDINYDKAIAERAAENEQLQKDNEDAYAVVASLMARLEKLEQNNVPLDTLTPPQLKALAKRRGVDVAGLKTKQELLAVLED